MVEMIVFEQYPCIILTEESIHLKVCLCEFWVKGAEA